MLVSYLRNKGIKVALTKEPTHDLIGSIIHKALYSLGRPLVKNKQANLRALQLLFVADRAMHLYNYIMPKEKQNYVVISDRYLLSTIIYGIASGINKRWLIELNKYFPDPDLTILIDVRPERAVERLNKRDVTTEYFENLPFIRKTKRIYLLMRSFHKNCYVVDGDPDKKRVAEQIRKIVDSKLKRR